MTRNNPITATVAEVAKAAGFRRHSSTWHKRAPIGLLVLDVQRSNWGGQCYLNLGVYVRGLGALSRPRSHECHFSTRATSLDRLREKQWDRVMNLDETLDEDERKREVTRLLSTVVLPFLDGLGTEEGMRTAAADGALRNGLLLATLRQHLGLT